MKLRNINIKEAKAVPLTGNELAILTTIYHSRLRLFAFVFPAFAFLGALNIRPRAWHSFINNADDLQFICGAITGVLIFLIIPFFVLFYKSIWVFRRDIKAGVKHEIQEQIIRKGYFPFTNQYFIALSDADYMHHEVTPEVYVSLEVGDFYPIYFAVFSRYPFTLRGRVTMM